MAVVGYVSLRLLRASAITAWLGIPSFDRWVMAADVAIFGKTPYLWFSQWGLDSDLFLRIMSGFYALYPFTPILAWPGFWFRRDSDAVPPGTARTDISLYCGYAATC